MTTLFSQRSTTAPNVIDEATDLTTEQQKGLICGILADFAADPDVDVLFKYLRHCGLPLMALTSADDLVPAFLGHYRIRPGLYDVDRACSHLLFWPPIAARIAELTEEAEAEAAKKEQRSSGRKRKLENLPDDL